MNCMQPTTTLPRPFWSYLDLKIGMGVVFCFSTNPVGSLVPSIHMLLSTCMQRPLSLCVLSTSSLLLRTTGETTCSNGFPDIEVQGVCCASVCLQCGGSGCGSQAQRVGLFASDCCVGRITSAGELCSDTRIAPCIIDIDGVCFAHSLTSSIPQQILLMSCPDVWRRAAIDLSFCLRRVAIELTNLGTVRSDEQFYKRTRRPRTAQLITNDVYLSRQIQVPVTILVQSNACRVNFVQSSGRVSTLDDRAVNDSHSYFLSPVTPVTRSSTEYRLQ